MSYFTPWQSHGVTADFGPSRTAPQALEAEEAVLGCILISPEAYLDVAPFLKAADFYLHKHRWVWDAIVRLNDQCLPVDTLTLTEELERHNQLAEIGGTAFLARLLNSVPTSLHVEAYGRIIEREATRRRLLEAASTIAQLAGETGRDIGEVLADAEATMYAVSERRGVSEAVSLSSAAHAYAARVAEGQSFGVSTGLPELNAVLGGGLQGSNLMLVAGRPGTGKTSFMLSVAREAAKHQQHIALFSGEMSNGELLERFLAQEQGLDPLRVRRNLLTLAECERYQAGLAELSRWPIALFPLGAVERLRAQCLRLASRDGLDLVIVDYLQQASASGRYSQGNREQEVARVAGQLKQLAQELGVPVLAGAQLSRAVEQRADRRPVLSDLRESGAQEQDADEVLFLHGVENGLRARTELILAKHRHGATHPGLEVLFDKPRFLFREC